MLASSERSPGATEQGETSTSGSVGGGAMRWFLMGFMGSGKTELGRLLAERWQVPFVDLDRLVEERAGRPIAAIFAEEGEASFRHRESLALRSLAGHESAVIALGGGTPLAPENRDWLRRNGTTVWLNPSFETILERLPPAERAHRPLFAEEERAAALYRERLAVYRTAADLELMVEPQEGPEEVLQRLEAKLAEQPCST